MQIPNYRPVVWFDADGGAGGGGAGGSGGDGGGEDNNPDGGGTPPEYKTWFQEQPEAIRQMLEKETSGLKSALKSERESRKDLETQLRDLAGKAEKGSEAETKLTQMADQLSESDRKADFYEAAHAAGVSNLKLAYLIAVQDEMFDRRGNVNFESMKKQYPELFGGTQKPPGNAGAGTDNNQPSGKSMNDFIRAAAGRK